MLLKSFLQMRYYQAKLRYKLSYSQSFRPNLVLYYSILRHIFYLCRYAKDGISSTPMPPFLVIKFLPFEIPNAVIAPSEIDCFLLHIAEPVPKLQNFYQNLTLLLGQIARLFRIQNCHHFGILLVEFLYPFLCGTVFWIFFGQLCDNGA